MNNCEAASDAMITKMDVVNACPLLPILHPCMWIMQILCRYDSTWMHHKFGGAVCVAEKCVRFYCFSMSSFSGLQMSARVMDIICRDLTLHVTMFTWRNSRSLYETLCFWPAFWPNNPTRSICKVWWCVTTWLTSLQITHPDESHVPRPVEAYENFILANKRIRN